MSEPIRKRKKTGDHNGSPSKVVKAKTGTEPTAAADFLEIIRQQRRRAAKSVKEFEFNKKRIRVVSKAAAAEVGDKCSSGGVVYWMSRDQRVQDNWALLYGQRLALKFEVPLHVCFCLVPRFLEATQRQYSFMLGGLKQVEKECQELGITFHLLIGYAKEVLPEFVKKNEMGSVVTDFSPLRVPAQWVQDVAAALPKGIPFCQIDAHNIVPCWEASPKLEYGARTIRKKITDKLPEYFTEFPPVIKHPHSPTEEFKDVQVPVDWEAAEASLDIDETVTPVKSATPGTEAGLRNLESFITKRLPHFATDSNDPNKKALSNMSPWLHFGQVAPQRAMLMVRPYKSTRKEAVERYLEEGIVRRELADNFCFYNENYDTIDGAYEWARKTLQIHKTDKRQYVYSREQLERGKTHDNLWNAAQRQMTTEGKMHGFLRMYWAKKILEWTESPEQALEFAIYLNDRYQLDGRDPSGYVGCMWSICGIHDQGWAEREIFGKIRFMNFNGCKRKFNVDAFITRYMSKK